MEDLKCKYCEEKVTKNWLWYKVCNSCYNKLRNKYFQMTGVWLS